MVDNLKFQAVPLTLKLVLKVEVKKRPNKDISVTGFLESNVIQLGLG